MSQTNKKSSDVCIYQGENWEILLRDDVSHNTIWASQSQISEIFSIDQSVVSRHIKNIFKDWEVDEKSNMQKMHIANSDKPVVFYNLDIILSVWYRTNSSKAIAFRQWATQVLKEHITQGYTINQQFLEKNHENFLQALSDIQSLLPEHTAISNDDILQLIKDFSHTWFQLESYDSNILPQHGNIQEHIQLAGNDLLKAIRQLREELLDTSQASKLFAQEKISGSVEGIFGNIFQSFDGKELYPTLEEKSAHLLYFMTKNHPFVDGNKRSAALSFIWFLGQNSYNFSQKISPATLSILTLFIAESDPKDKDKVIGLVLLLLQ